MANQILGNWQEVASENVDGYMKSMGVDASYAQITGGQKPKVEITENGGSYTIKSLIGPKESVITFKLGESFEETDAAGRKSTSIFKLDGNKLVKEQETAGVKTKSIREVKDGALIITMIGPGDVTATVTMNKA